MAKKEKAAEATEGAEAPEAKGSSKKLIIIGVAMLLGGVFAGKTFFGGTAAQTTTVVLKTEPTVTIDYATATAIPLQKQAVLLTDGWYLSFSLTVTLAPEEGAAEEGKIDLAAEAPKFEYLRDEARQFIAGHTSTDVQGVRFVEELKTHLMERAELRYGEKVAAIAIGDWAPAQG